MTSTLPPRCLSFTVRGDFGHFRRVDGTVVRQTYKLPPRTTVAGLLSAVAGLERDSYYDQFGPDTSAVAISLLEPSRTYGMPENVLSTAKNEGLKGINTRGSGVGIRLPDYSHSRQQQVYEFLIDPAYRIDVWVSDDDLYATLKDHLESGTAVYTPVMGLSECLATIEYHGEFDVDPFTGQGVVIDSAVPDAVEQVIPVPGKPFATERSPGFMCCVDTPNGTRRQTTGFIDWLYMPDSSPVKVSRVDSAGSVDGRTVVFS